MMVDNHLKRSQHCKFIVIKTSYYVLTGYVLQYNIAHITL